MKSLTVVISWSQFCALKLYLTDNLKSRSPLDTVYPNTKMIRQLKWRLISKKYAIYIFVMTVIIFSFRVEMRLEMLQSFYEFVCYYYPAWGNLISSLYSTKIWNRNKFSATFSTIGALGSSSPRRIFSIHGRASGPKPSFRFRGRLGGVKKGSPALRTIIASSGISAGGLRLLEI